MMHAENVLNMYKNGERAQCLHFKLVNTFTIDCNSRVLADSDLTKSGSTYHSADAANVASRLSRDSAICDDLTRSWNSSRQSKTSHY